MARKLNLTRTQATSKVQTDGRNKLLYVDCMTENARTGTKCNGLWTEFHKHLTTMNDLIISTKRLSQKSFTSKHMESRTAI